VQQQIVDLGRLVPVAGGLRTGARAGPGRPAGSRAAGVWPGQL